MTDAEPKRGKGHPPKEHRIKKGESRNPRGRPKGVKSPKQAIMRVLKRKVTAADGGKITIQYALVQRLVQLAMDGNANAFRRYRKLHQRISASPANEAMSEDEIDRLLDDQFERIRKNRATMEQMLEGKDDG